MRTHACPSGVQDEEQEDEEHAAGAEPGSSCQGSPAEVCSAREQLPGLPTKGEGGKYNWACKSGPYNQEWEGQKCMCKSQCLLTHGKYGRCWSSEGFAHNGMPYWLGYEYNDFHRTNGGPYHRG